MRVHHTKKHGESLTYTTRTCDHCGEEYEVREWWEDASRFCSPKCNTEEEREAQIPDKRLSDEEWCRQRYCEQDMSLESIAEICGAGATSVSNWLKYHGIDVTGPGGVPVGDVERLRKKEWLQKAYIDDERPISDIAESLSVSKRTVFNWLRRHEIETRDRSTCYTQQGTVYGEGWSEEKRERVRRRDNRCCQGCGLSEEDHLERHGERLHVHHIQPAKTFDSPQKRNSVDNLIALCCTCHHSKWEPMAPLRPDTRQETVN